MLSRFRVPPPQWSVRRRIAGRTFPSNISLANVWDSSVCDTSPGLGCEMALNGKVCPSCSRRSIFPSLQAFMRHSKQLTCSFGFEDWWGLWSTRAGIVIAHVRGTDLLKGTSFSICLKETNEFANKCFTSLARWNLKEVSAPLDNLLYAASIAHLKLILSSSPHTKLGILGHCLVFHYRASTFLTSFKHCVLGCIPPAEGDQKMALQQKLLNNWWEGQSQIALTASLERLFLSCSAYSCIVCVGLEGNLCIIGLIGGRYISGCAHCHCTDSIQAFWQLVLPRGFRKGKIEDSRQIRCCYISWAGLHHVSCISNTQQLLLLLSLSPFHALHLNRKCFTSSTSPLSHSVHFLSSLFKPLHLPPQPVAS